MMSLLLKGKSLNTPLNKSISPIENNAPIVIKEHFWFSEMTQDTHRIFETEIKNFEELMAIVSLVCTKKNKVIWRGLSSLNYSICSALDRHVFAKQSPELSKCYFQAKKNLKSGNTSEGSASFLKQLNLETQEWENKIQNSFREWGFPAKSYENDFDKWTHQQHFGVPTRLIDFSWNPLVALWFAICFKENNNNDSRIICFDLDHDNEISSTIVDPDPSESRVRVQQGTFAHGLINPRQTTVPASRTHLNDGKKKLSIAQKISISMVDVSFSALNKNGSKFTFPSGVTNKSLNLVIRKKNKESFRKVLTAMGFTYPHLFPDMAGFSAYIQSGSPYDREILKYRTP